MTEWIRVKDKNTGHEQTINAALFNEQDYVRLEDKVATDTEGRPLPGKPNANLPKAEPPDADASAEADGDASTGEPLPPPPEATPPSTKSGRASRA